MREAPWKRIGCVDAADCVPTNGHHSPSKGLGCLHAAHVTVFHVEYCAPRNFKTSKTASVVEDASSGAAGLPRHDHIRTWHKTNDGDSVRRPSGTAGLYVLDHPLLNDSDGQP